MTPIRRDMSSVLAVPLTTFAEYLTASASSKIDCVKDQIRIFDQPYRPGAAFYHDFKEAVVEGRECGADHLAMQRVVAAQRDPARYKHYDALAQHWLAMPSLHLPLVPYGQAVWQTPRLGVRIRPDFAATDPKGKLFVVKLWLKDRVLVDDASRAMLRLFGHHMTDICPGATPLVVDVRREKIHKPTRREPKRGFDEWLENEAGSMAGLWERLAAA